MRFSDLLRLFAAAVMVCAMHTGHAQLYNRLHAYDNGGNFRAGAYFDVTNLPAASRWGDVPVAVGRSAGIVTEGSISRFDLAGVNTQTDAFLDVGTAEVLGVTIDKGLGDDVVAAFRIGTGTPAVSEIIRFNLFTGAIVWARRIDDFEVKDLQVAANTTGPGNSVIITGRRSNARLPLFSIDYATGAMNWGFNYTAQSFNFPAQVYSRLTGFELDVEPSNGNITVAGTGDRGVNKTDLFVLRTTNTGAFVWARNIGDQFGTEFYHGKCLTRATLSPGSYFIGVEWSNSISPQLHAAALEINSLGGVSWANYYPGNGFFAGDDYFVSDIDYIGDLGKDRILVTGYFHEPSLGVDAGYSLVLTGWGTGLIHNEYQTAAANSPITTRIHGIERKPGQLRHSVVGNYEVVGGAGGIFPGGTGPNTFWALGVSHTGNTGGAVPCRNFEYCDQFALVPDEMDAVVNQVFDTTTVFPGLVATRAISLDANNCGTPKTAPESTPLEVSIQHQQLTVLAAEELAAPGRVQLWDLSGRLLWESTLTHRHSELPLGGISDGVYLLRYDLPGIGAGTEKIAVQH